MKVICIDASGLSLNGCKTSLEEGVIYTATQCVVYSHAYKLKEIPNNEKGWPISFKKTRFAPLSEIDETEFIREYKKELV